MSTYASCFRPPLQLPYVPACLVLVTCQHGVVEGRLPKSFKTICFTGFEQRGVVEGGVQNRVCVKERRPFKFLYGHGVDELAASGFGSWALVPAPPAYEGNVIVGVAAGWLAMRLAMRQAARRQGWGAGWLICLLAGWLWLLSHVLGAYLPGWLAVLLVGRLGCWLAARRPAGFPRS